MPLLRRRKILNTGRHGGTAAGVQLHGGHESFRRRRKQVSEVALRLAELSKFAAFGLWLFERYSLPSSFVLHSLVSFRNVIRIAVALRVVYCYNPSVYEMAGDAEKPVELE